MSSTRLRTHRRTARAVLVAAAATALTLGGAAAPSRASIFGTPAVFNETMITGADVETHDHFGRTLEHGDFDADGHPDIVVGHPGEMIGGFPAAGAVTVVYGDGGGGLDDDHVQRVHWQTTGMPAGNQINSYGSALAVGDLDLDGFDDLAVGAPDDQVGLEPHAGSVTVLFGSPSGLGDPRWFSEDSPQVPGESFEENHFGFSLAIGRLDQTGGAELVVGAPQEDGGGSNQAGRAEVLQFSTSRSVTGGFTLRRGGLLGGSPSEHQNVGFALAIGDLDGDGADDLAVGAPAEETNTLGAGRIYLCYGPVDQNDCDGHKTLTQGVDGSGTGTAEAGDMLGEVLLTADLKGTGRDALVAGVPHEDGGGLADVGEVDVFYLSTGRAVSGQQWHQNSPGVADSNETGDHFGAALAAANLDGDGLTDLAVGVVGEGGPSLVGAGAVITLRDTATTVASELLDRSHPSTVPGNAATGENCGDAVTAANIGSEPRAELFVGCPGTVIGGVNGGGEVIQF